MIRLILKPLPLNKNACTSIHNKTLGSALAAVMLMAGAGASAQETDGVTGDKTGLVAEDALSTLRIHNEKGVNGYTVVACEPLWERDLSVWDLTKGDANENQHNVFVRDGVVYLFTAKYAGANNPQGLALRCFDAATGGFIDEKALDFGSALTNQSTRLIMADLDDAGNLVVLSLAYKKDATNVTNATTPVLHLDGVVVPDLSDLSSYSPIQPFAPAGSGVNGLYFYSEASLGNIRGNFAAGDGVFTLAGWTAVSARSTDGKLFNYLPGMAKFTGVGVGSTPEVSRALFPCGDGAPFAAAGMPVETGSTYKNIIYSHLLDDKTAIVQGHFSTLRAVIGSSESTADNCKLSPKATQWQTSTLYDASPIISGDDYSTGMWPVLLGDEMVMVAPDRTFDATCGSTFRFSLVTDRNTYSLSPMYVYPQAKNFGVPAANSIYQTVSPKVAVDYAVAPRSIADIQALNEVDTTPCDATPYASATPSSATVYTYMPGSGLGAYRLTSWQSGTPANSVSILDTTPGTRLDATLCDGILHLRGYAPTATDLKLYTIDGRLLSTLPIDRTHDGETLYPLTLPGGIHLLTDGVTALLLRPTH